MTSAPDANHLFDLSGKVALITGGSRGLGRQMALAFARQGADIVITSRKIETCEEVADEIRGLGRRALAHACHVGRWSEIDALVEAAYDAFGKVDILVNNAGMSPIAPTSVETTEALFDKVIAVNFKGAFRLGALIGARMAAGEGGSIINISSSGALFPQPGIIPYAGAKAAMNAMTVGWAKEFGPKVRVNTISPGPFLTDVSNHWENREQANSSLGRAGQPDEIVTTALYLASSASSFTTASLIRVDGGL